MSRLEGWRSPGNQQTAHQKPSCSTSPRRKRIGEMIQRVERGGAGAISSGHMLKQFVPRARHGAHRRLAADSTTTPPRLPVMALSPSTYTASHRWCSRGVRGSKDSVHTTNAPTLSTSSLTSQQTNPPRPLCVPCPQVQVHDAPFSLTSDHAEPPGPSSYSRCGSDYGRSSPQSHGDLHPSRRHAACGDAQTKDILGETE